MAKRPVPFDRDDRDDELWNKTLRLRMPLVREFLKPSEFLAHLRVFVVDWFITRDFRQIFIGVPFLVAAISGTIAVVRLGNQADETLALTYQGAVLEATLLDRIERADLMRERLMQLMPEEPKFRFSLLLSLMQQGKYDQARRHVEFLIESHGYAPARLWLIRQARDDEPIFPISAKEQVSQLQAILAELPNDEEANYLLAMALVDQMDYQLAESHLLRAVNQHRTLGLPLYELQMFLGRTDLTAARNHLLKAALELESQVLKSPADSTLRIRWARTLSHLDKADEAAQVLSAGIANYDSPEIRNAAATFFLASGQQLVNKSSLNSGKAAELLLRAAEADPSHPALPRACMALARGGVRLAPKALIHVAEIHRSRTAEADCPPGERLVFARFLAMLREYDEAADLLESLPDDPEAQALLYQVYRFAGRQDEGELLISAMLAQRRSEFSRDSSDVQAVTNLAGCLAMAEQHAAVIELINGYCDRTGHGRSELPLVLKNLYVPAAVQLFQAAEEADTASDSEFELLVRANETGILLPGFIELLAGLRVSDGPFAEKAGNIITQRLAAGSGNSLIYRAVGERALHAGKPDLAVRALQTALEHKPDDPILQNNLAMALIRQSRDNAQQALALCEAALEMAPGYPDIVSTRGEIHAARSRWTIARVDLETTLQQRPRDKDIRKLLVRVYTELDEHALAKEHQKKLNELMAEGAD